MGDLTNKNEEVEFDWITLRKDMGEMNVIETSKEKMMRKIKENPLVPIGCLATACALTFGLWSFHKGDRKMSQYMMRTRIVAQGFTVFALVVGIGMTAAKHKSPM